LEKVECTKIADNKIVLSPIICGVSQDVSLVFSISLSIDDIVNVSQCNTVLYADDVFVKTVKICKNL